MRDESVGKQPNFPQNTYDRMNCSNSAAVTSCTYRLAETCPEHRREYTIKRKAPALLQARGHIHDNHSQPQPDSLLYVSGRAGRG